MLKGFFVQDENTPVVQISIGWGDVVSQRYLVVDTGFTGDIKIGRKAIEELGIPVISSESVMNMNGEIVQAPLALAYAEIDGEKKAVSILVIDGMELSGIGLYSKFGKKVTVDCLNRTVEIENADEDEQ